MHTKIAIWEIRKNCVWFNIDFVIQRVNFFMLIQLTLRVIFGSDLPECILSACIASAGASNDLNCHPSFLVSLALNLGLSSCHQKVIK